MKTLRERLAHILEITENQPEENVLIILKTMVAEYEDKLYNPEKHQFKQSTQHTWRNRQSRSKDDI